MKAFGKPEASGNSFKYRDTLFFLKFVKPLWKLGIAGLSLTVASAALGSLLPLSSKALMDYIILENSSRSIEVFLEAHHLGTLAAPAARLLGSASFLALAVMIAGTIIGSIGIFERMITLRFQQEILFNTQTSLFDRVLRFPISFFKDRQVGYLMSRVSGDVGLLQYFFSNAVPRLATDSFYCFFGFAILFTLNATLSLAMLALLPVLALINYMFAGKVRSVSHREMERRAMISKDMQEALSGAELIKAFGSEKREVDKVSANIRGFFSAKLRSAILTSVSASLARASRIICTLAVVLLGVPEIRKGTMSVGDFTAFSAYAFYLSGRLIGMSSIFMTLQPVLASMGRLKELFDTIPESTDEESARDTVKPSGPACGIRFENVSFSYDGDKCVLDKMSFKIHPGETIALTGASGTGKTTLANLLLKFYRPQSGAIYMDGLPLDLIDTNRLRERVGIVSQDVFLFNDTVKNNIKYGRPSASMEQVVDAAEHAGIRSDIEALNNGYETVVGERGVKLSAGQRQRISIARAFLKNPPILILDEPSSALDPETEEGLKNSFEKLAKNRTVIIISHRMSITDIADRVLHLEGGRIRQ